MHVKLAVGAAALALLLAGCPTSKRVTAPAQPSGAGVVEAPRPAAGPAERFRIDPERSVLILVVGRAGPLAKAAHNHVIASRNLIGTVDLREPVAASSFELRVPVALLTVDEPGLREGRGPDFPPEVPEAASKGTRENMLGDALLDAERYPGIVVESVAVRGGPAAFVADLRLTVKERVSELSVPLELRRTAGELRAVGKTTLSHTQLGLTPFSAMMGAIQVKDSIDVEFDLIARRDVQ